MRAASRRAGERRRVGTSATAWSPCANPRTRSAPPNSADLGPVPWGTSGPQCVGITTILLNSVWLGIAEAAASRAHAFVRADARKRIG